MIKPGNYKKGKKDKIASHERIIIICDRCNYEWETYYHNYKVKKSKTDLCQSCKNKLGICGMKGRKHSKKSKNKMSQHRGGKDNPFYGCTHSDRQKKKWSKERLGVSSRIIPISYEEKQMRSKSTKLYWEGLSEEEKIVRISKNRYDKILKKLLNNGGRYSKLHQRVKNDLNKFGLVDFISEEYIGKYVVDELSITRKIVVEVNGDYWHANPKKYSANEEIFYPKGIFLAKDIWKRDKSKIDFLRNKGLKVIVIWEDEVKHDKHIDIIRSL